MPEIDALAKNLRELRNAMRETQFEFAEGCGLSDDIIQLMETKRANPRLSTLQNIAAYTGVSVSDLLKVEEEKE